jgi:hypothetical protein
MELLEDVFALIDNPFSKCPEFVSGSPALLALVRY